MRRITRAIAAIERRAPWLNPAPTAATLRAVPERSSQTVQQAERSGRRRAATLVLAAILIAGVGGLGALVLSTTSPELDAAAKARAALEQATRSIDEALDKGIASNAGPVVIAEPADNAGGGAPSDSTFVLKRMLERGILQHNIAQRLSLDEIASAHEQVEQGGLTGNLVLRIDP